MKRQWLLAIGSGALLSGIALFAVTLAAVPTTTIFGSEVPMACANGSSQQACADATARLTVMKQIQPISWFITAVGAVILVYTALQKTEVSREKMLAPEANLEDGTSNLRNEGQLARMKHVKQVKQVEMATCGNCNASVRDDALRCPSCGAQFA